MKFLGSKSRIAKHIVPIIQKAIDNNDIHYYLEPFLGGCNTIDKIKCDRKFGYDLDKYLIYLFIHLKEGGTLPESIPKEEYDKLRSAWYEGNRDKKYPDWLIGCACYLASYNGRDFSAGYGKPVYENTAKGKRYRDYYKEAKDNLLKQIEQPLWQDIMFGISDYRDLDSLSDYVIYADPPYQNTKQYANSKYFSHTTFWETMRKWSKDNIVFISELTAPDDFKCVWEQEVSRSIKTTDKTKATEKLFRYKYGRK